MRAKKSLGQNFLKSGLALKKIIEAGNITSDDIILEIGPGKGMLTGELLEKAKKVIAVEKDNQLFDFLKIKFIEQIKSGSLVLVHGDILGFSVPLRYKVIANIPYNITGAILKKFLTEKNQPESMILMVQHEVAKRIVAHDNKESILSISVKAYGEPKMVMKVPARYFSPAPKVDSAVIAINHISRKIFKENKIDEKKFWEIVKIGFAHKRKKLSGNLKSVLNLQKEPFLAFRDKRAEDLSLLDWILLTATG
ncbi:MAG TPA: 16S rRNA (adenine(1518)-N(6)/adenine(1519)-N(6))-dimethyltransferase RsmA [Candidatus Paceibacterota bacterium]|jgi:16S rRNA (adenine1518-N6/adenine1519-N6)-dimethyltransferase|nr:16S rRNA (adenine(1518)-N(6)/adenine(1519)-N(6))-dimethyltransferase RsmA [Candidatus Paceibacterota bacterium]